jgi:protein TonB
MTTVERKGKLKPQISPDPFLLFVLTSVLIHGVGVLMLVLSNRSLPTVRQETESTPIDFVVVPPEESPEEPPPDTERRAVNNSVAKGKVEPELPSATDKIGNEEAIAPSEPTQATQPDLPETPSASVIPPTPPPPRVEPTPRAEPQSVTPPTSVPKVPQEALAPSTPTQPPEEIKPVPPVLSKPKPIEKAPLLSGADSASIPLPKPAPLQEETTSREIETATPKPDLPPVATNSTLKPKPIEPSSQSTEPLSVPETTPTPSSEQENPVGSGSASLLGGTYRKTLSEDSASSFFTSQANASQQALNPSGLDARQDLDLGPYFAEIRRRVKRNWQPSAPSDNRHTVLAFSIQRNGQITGLRVVQSSGSPKSDRDSLEAIEKSAPFAALPENFPNEQLNVEFNFNIYVNQGVFTPQLENWQRF